jgi:membrane protein DedA with SNARE-associated domain
MRRSSFRWKTFWRSDSAGCRSVTLEAHLAYAEPVLKEWGNWAVFACIFVEGVGIPAPGQTLLIGAALLAGRGKLALLPLLVVAVLAAALGNAVGWLIGRAGGRALLQRIAHGERLARVERLFTRWGPRLVGLGRFVDGLRQINGIAAGALGMEATRFLIWNAFGAILWVGFWGLGAYGFGRDFSSITSAIHRASSFLWPLVVVGALLLLLYLIRVPWRRPRA